MSDLCEFCGGHGSVMRGERVNDYGRTVPNFVPCPVCDQRDRVTPLLESRAESEASA